MRKASLTYVRLISPLLPPSKLAVRIVGTPPSRADESFREELVRAASTARAHRSHGAAVLEVSFDGAVAHVDGPNVVIPIPEVRNPVRRLKAILVLFVSLVVTRALLHSKTSRARRRRAMVRHEYVRW